MRRKKFLGQHFLSDKNILRKIVTAAELSGKDTVLEIGPGTGTLTAELLPRAGRVIAVEKDERLCALLNERFGAQKKFSLVCGDILQFDPSRFMLRASRFKIVANIPYYLTGRLLRLMFSVWPRPKLAVLMLQHEVAKRLTAAPPNMNRLAAICRSVSSPEIVAVVRPGSFHPPPKVHSAIVALRDIRPPRKDDPRVEAVITAGFAHPRKLLATNLARRFGREPVLAALAKLGLSSSVRPAELEIAHWAALSTLLFGNRHAYTV